MLFFIITDTFKKRYVLLFIIFLIFPKSLSATEFDFGKDFWNEAEKLGVSIQKSETETPNTTQQEGDSDKETARQIKERKILLKSLQKT